MKRSIQELEAEIEWLNQEARGQGAIIQSRGAEIERLLATNAGVVRESQDHRARMEAEIERLKAEIERLHGIVQFGETASRQQREGFQAEIERLQSIIEPYGRK